MIFALKRIGQTLFAIAILMTLTFWLLHVLPGGPFDSENVLPPEVKAALEVRYHLDKPLVVQYLIYVKSLGLGDLGQSLAYSDQSISEILKSTVPVTMELGLLSLILSFVLGLPAGLWAARFHGKTVDHAIMFLAGACLSLPVFLIAPLLILIFSFWLDLLPPALWDGPQFMILPVVTLALRPAALIARLVRVTALDLIHSDFIRAARAKGQSENFILYKHVLKNSLIPVLGISGPLVANVLSGSFVVEMMFAIPGLGGHFVESVSNRDYPLVMALTLFYAVMLSVCTLVADLLSMAVDPRVAM